MKKRILYVVITLLPVYAVSQCEDNRYQAFLFAGYDVSTDIIYGENLNSDGVVEQLKMDVYTPQGDDVDSRALVILCHGGYFLYGDKAEIDVMPFCMDLSKMGYVVASINYRMGIEFETPLNEPYGRAVMRAVQDMRAAIRWFRKNAEEGNTFGIDPDQVYAGGISAGGFMSIHHAYMDEDEIPEYIDMTAPGLEGGMDGQSGNPGYSSDVNAIFSISGAIGDTAWIDPGEEPVCLFHGDEDTTIPYGTGTFYLFGLAPVVELDGSYTMNITLDETGIEHCFETNEGFGHVPYLGNEEVYDTTLSILTGFLAHFICGTTLDCSYNEIPSSLEERIVDSFEIFPNPASRMVTIVVPGNAEKKVVIRNYSGQMIMEEKTQHGGHIDISHLDDGLYIFSVDGISRKLIVMHGL